MVFEREGDEDLEGHGEGRKYQGVKILSKKG